MSNANADRFRDLLFKAAPVINLVDGSGPWIRKIIEIAGGAGNVYDHVATFPQFCFEMLFCMMVDTSHRGLDGLQDCVISQACESMCTGIADSLTWPLADEEQRLLKIVGFREPEDGAECMEYFKFKWCPDEEVKQ
ncbi:MAG: hypothetical protein LBB34_02505 [Holosporales bacterium]|jgi:hypothetical protein|nr:hypothetical protein [Holosporales bacterium]